MAVAGVKVEIGHSRPVQSADTRLRVVLLIWQVLALALLQQAKLHFCFCRRTQGRGERGTLAWALPAGRLLQQREGKPLELPVLCCENAWTSARRAIFWALLVPWPAQPHCSCKLVQAALNFQAKLPLGCRYSMASATPCC